MMQDFLSTSLTLILHYARNKKIVSCRLDVELTPPQKPMNPFFIKVKFRREEYDCKISDPWTSEKIPKSVIAEFTDNQGTKYSSMFDYADGEWSLTPEQPVQNIRVPEEVEAQVVAHLNENIIPSSEKETEKS